MYRAALTALFLCCCSGGNNSRVYVAPECYEHFDGFASELDHALSASCEAGYQCAEQYMGQDKRYIRVTCPTVPSTCNGVTENLLGCYRGAENKIEIYRYLDSGDQIRFVQPEDDCTRSRGLYDVIGYNILSHEFGHAQGFEHAQANRVPVMQQEPSCNEYFRWTP